MAKQFIDTERVASRISQIWRAKNNINKAFDSMEKLSLSLLESNWRSKAGDKAASTLRELLKNNTARDTVLKNYISLLEQQVNPGYENAESVNKSLASQFK